MGAQCRGRRAGYRHDLLNPSTVLGRSRPSPSGGRRRGGQPGLGLALRAAEIRTAGTGRCRPAEPEDVRREKGKVGRFRAEILVGCHGQKV